MHRANRITAMVLGISLMSGTAYAMQNTPDPELHHIQTEWAHIVYQMHGHDAQVDAIEALKKEATKYVADNPNDPEALLWEGIVTSEHASIASVFHQLGLAKDARDIFDKVLKMDPGGVNGAAQMSLGVLYYRVPGFPIGFGDDDTARKDLQFALSKDPDGLDANYFYGDFLAEQGDEAQARTVLKHALEAPVNKDRPVWDAGRRAEVRELISKIDKDTKS